MLGKFLLCIWVPASLVVLMLGCQREVGFQIIHQ